MTFIQESHIWDGQRLQKGRQNEAEQLRSRMRKREKAGDKRESVEKKSNNKKRMATEDIKRNEQMTKGTCRKVSVYIEKRLKS